MALKTRREETTEAVSGRNGTPESNIIIFTSAKGGSGCSFMVNTIASYMAKKTTLNVLLIDMNIGRMDSRIIFGIKGPAARDLGDFPEGRDRLNTLGLKKIVINLENSLNLILPPLRIEKASFLGGYSLALLIEAVRNHFDLICIDMPEYLLTQIDMAELDISDRFVFITLPDIFSANNTRILMDHISEYRSQHDFYLVVNKYNLKTAISFTGLSNILGYPIATFIPYDRDIEDLVNKRGPGHVFRYGLKITRNISSFAARLYGDLGV